MNNIPAARRLIFGLRGRLTLVFFSVMPYTRGMPSYTQNRRARWPWGLAVLTALAGTVLTAVIWLRVATREEQEALQAFHAEAESLRDRTTRELNIFAEVLDSIRALHGLSAEVSERALEEFVDKGMLHQQTILGAFGFAQHISHPVRQALETTFEETGLQGYRVVSREADGSWKPVDPRPVYFPLTWQSGVLALGAPIGYDFLSRDDTRAAIDRMARHGRPALVEHPIADRNDVSRTHWVFSPIFHLTDGATHPPGILIGFAVGLWDPETTLARLTLNAPHPPGAQLALLPTQEAITESRAWREAGHWHFAGPVHVFDALWRLDYERAAAPVRSRSIAVLLTGALLTAWMTSQMLLIAGRSRRIEEEVNARTEELQHANHALEKEIEERSRLENEMRDISTRERRKLGRDLHDSLGQKLTGAMFLSRSLMQPVDGSATRTEHARTLNTTLKEAVGQVRAMARGLAPVTLDEHSLGEALQGLAMEVTSVYGVSCEAQTDADDAALDPKVREEIYWIAREAVHNAARHAQAERIHLEWRGTESSGYVLRVWDNGMGLPLDAESGAGMGLRGMRHRARIIGGELAIIRRTEGGMEIVCKLRQPARR